MKNKVFAGMLVSTVLIFLIGIYIYSINLNPIVAKVGESEINKNELTDYLYDVYEDTGINSLIEQELIDQQFKKENVPITEKEELNQLKYVQLIDQNKNSLTNKSTKFYVDQYIKVKILSSKLGIVTDDILRDFIEEQVGENGDKILEVTETIGSHSDLEKIEELVKDNQEYHSYISENNLKSETHQIFSLFNEYEYDFSYSKVGETQHFMTDTDSDKMSLVVIDSVESSKESVMNLENNREIVENVYFSKNYNNVKIKLINELRKLYVIKK